MLDFRQNLYVEEHNFRDASELVSFESDIPTSEQISGIEVRLSQVIVKDNKTARIWPFKGLAQLYFLNVVVSDLSTDDIQLDLKGFEKVDDGDALSVDRTLFFWKKMNAGDKVPSQIHIMTSLVKSKQGLRDAAAIMTEAKEDSDYKNIIQQLGSVIKTATSVTNVSNLIFGVASVVGKYLGNVDDKPLLTWVQSFTDINGDFNQLGKTEKHAGNNYATMTLSITIRDKERQQEIDSN